MPELDRVRELRATAEHLRRLAQAGRADPDYVATVLARAAELDEETDGVEGNQGATAHDAEERATGQSAAVARDVSIRSAPASNAAARHRACAAYAPSA